MARSENSNGLAIVVEFLTRTGKIETAKFFDETRARSFYDLGRGNGRNLGGAVCVNQATDNRAADFGTMRGGVSAKDARKEYRKAAKAQEIARVAALRG